MGKEDSPAGRLWLLYENVQSQGKWGPKEAWGHRPLVGAGGWVIFKHYETHDLKAEESKPGGSDSMTTNFGAPKKGWSTQWPLWVTFCC